MAGHKSRSTRRSGHSPNRPGPRNKLHWVSRPEGNTGCVTWAKPPIPCMTITVSAEEQVTLFRGSGRLGYLEAPQTRGTQEASIYVRAGVPTPAPFNHGSPAFILDLGVLPKTVLEERRSYPADDNTVPSNPKNSQFCSLVSNMLRKSISGESNLSYTAGSKPMRHGDTGL